MKRYKRKTACIILTLTMLVSLLSFSSCNRKFDEQEVIFNAEKLLKQAEMLNIVYYGSGIEFYDTEDGIGYYRKANEQSLEKLGFKTIDDLKKITEKTFSANYTNTIYSTILSALRDDISVISNARYYQAYDEKTGEPTHIMVHSKYEPLLKSTVNYDYSSLKVNGSKKEKVHLTVNATVTNAEGKTQQAEIIVTLVEEENGWRIDNPTYTNFNASMDRYDELKDQDIK